MALLPDQPRRTGLVGRTPLSTGRLQRARRRLGRDGLAYTNLHARHWIGGTWVDSPQRLKSRDPATGDRIGTYADTGEEEVAQAIHSAVEAFRAGGWRTDRRLRARALIEMADRFEASAEDLIEVLSLENGKAQAVTGSRLLVHPPILDSVRERFAKRLEAVKSGPASNPASDMGPMINNENVERVDRLVDEVISQGAWPIVRGGPVKEGPLAKGAFYRPTLLEITDHSMPIAQNEVFGPVLVMQAFDTEAEAVRLASDSEYGLAASIWSHDVDRPLRIARQIEAGTVWINNWAVVYDESEEGGYKQSGVGRLNGAPAIHDFLEYKAIVHEVAL